MLDEGPMTPGPAEFAASVAQSNGYELAAAWAALAQSGDRRIRAFANRMLAEHEHMGRALGEAAKASGIEPPRPHVGGDHMRLLSGLQSLRDHDFDREYARQQMLAHASMLASARRYADKGGDLNLRRLAASSVGAIEGHLEAARQLMQALAAG